MVFRTRWSPRSRLFAALSVIAGVAAFGIIHGYAARLEALRPLAGERVPVLVASRSLQRGTVLTPELLRVQWVPSDYAPPGALGSFEQAEGRTLVSDMTEGEILTRTRVGAVGGAVASLVPPGLRAFPVQASVPQGALRPGDRVDVLATFGGPRPYTDTVAAGLEVLAIVDEEQDAFSSAGHGPSLILLVSPDAAERLAYAVAFGRLSITVGSTQEAAG